MPPEKTPASGFWHSEDAVAIVTAFSILLLCVVVTLGYRPSHYRELSAQHQEISRESTDKTGDDARANRLERLKKIEAQLGPQVFKGWWLKVSEWSADPIKSFQNSKGAWQGRAFLTTGLVLLGLTSIGTWWQRHSITPFVVAFLCLYLLTILAFVLSSQTLLKYYNLEYPLWALLVGLIIANTVNLPPWLQPAVKPDLYVKIGLILLGAEVLFGKLLTLGLPGILVSWTVTPIVLIGTYIFGQRVLKIESRSLNMVISADMSVCGVSAAIATASAVRAKKEELSLAIAMSLIFTVVMMIVQPFCIRWMGLNDVVAGAWLGGTIDSTGAVAAAGELLKSDVARDVAVTVKMIQNILIGVFAIGIAAYWATFVEQKKRKDGPPSTRVGLYEIWRRFPKFAIGFLGASLIFSVIQNSGVFGNALVTAVVDGTGKELRTWFFGLAFVCIGLESNMRQYAFMLRNGKPLVLYLVGQAFNLVLSLIACLIVFYWLFREAAESLMKL